MVPAPTAIVAVARKRSPEHVFWVVNHGIKMTGVPAWKYRLSERELWQVVAFVKQIPALTTADYALLAESAASSSVDSGGVSASTQDLDSQQPDQQQLVETGRVALQQYNCISCHSIPGVTAGINHVGPPLGGITRRAFIAGVLQYSDENLIEWIRFPLAVDPDTAMPNIGVTEAHARAMLAYFKATESDNSP